MCGTVRCIEGVAAAMDPTMTKRLFSQGDNSHLPFSSPDGEEVKDVRDGETGTDRWAKVWQRKRDETGDDS